MKSWTRFCEETTIHGMKHLKTCDPVEENKNRPKKTLWALLICFNVMLFIVLFITVFSNLMWPNVATKVELEFRNKAQFPAITICNANQFRKSFAEQSVELRFVLAEWHPMFLSYFFPNITEYVEALETVNLEEINVRKLFTSAGHNMDDMIISIWNSTATLETGLRDYFQPIFTEMGMCYTYWDPNWTVYTPGLAYGITFLIDPGLEEYYFSEANPGGQGIKFMVHDRSNIPDLQSHGRLVGPDMEAIVPFLSEHHDITKNWQIQCVQNDDHIMGFDGFGYSFEYCSDYCLANFTRKYCRCAAFYDNFEDNFPVCMRKEDISCLSRVKAEFYTSQKRSTCGCESECVWNIYDLDMSQSPFPAKYFQDLVEKHPAHPNNTARMGYLSTMDARRTNRSIIKLSVYYESLDQFEFTDILTYSTSDIWGDIGGVLGLTFGASILTVVELMEYSFAILLASCACIAKKKKTNVVCVKETVKQYSYTENVKMQSPST